MTRKDKIRNWFSRKAVTALWLLLILVALSEACQFPGGIFGVAEQHRLFAKRAKELDEEMRLEKLKSPPAVHPKNGDFGQ